MERERERRDAIQIRNRQSHVNNERYPNSKMSRLFLFLFRVVVIDLFVCTEFEDNLLELLAVCKHHTLDLALGLEIDGQRVVRQPAETEWANGQFRKMNANPIRYDTIRHNNCRPFKHCVH